MNERRLSRLQEQIKARVAQVIDNQIADPRRGLITITRVKLDREMTACKVYWSVLGDERDRVRNERMLARAARYVQREVAGTLRTRTVPEVRFEFDESIAGAIRVDDILRELRAEREAREERPDAGAGPAGEPPA